MRVQPNPQLPGQRAAGARNGSSELGFAGSLERAASGLRLSNHAQKRVDSRQLNLTAPQLGRLDSAIGRAAQKGARSSVVMLDDLAVVVDVQARTVITAMQQQGQKGRVFTNIDSVVIA
jgi:flagellar operon protein